LLPLYRGAAPVNWAIVQGEKKTGVTTMFIEEQLDAGPILLQRETDIEERETAPELMGRLALWALRYLVKRWRSSTLLGRVHNTIAMRRSRRS